MIDIFLEQIHENWGQWFKVENVLYQEKNDLCEQLVFDSPTLGKVHVIDGVVQSTEKDEFVYQEMLSHVPLIAHGHAKKVLIIGGGDGGILREVLKHQTLESVQLCTIDASEVEFAKKLLPHLSQGAFENSKAKIFINDGAVFVKECQDKFDVIIVDSSDPVGPSAVLFTEEFYGDCKALLNEGGVLANMADVPFMQVGTLKLVNRNLKKTFGDVHFFLAAAPTYVGGFMALGFATDNAKLKNVSMPVLKDRFRNISGDLMYYNPQVHQASFALPNFIKNALN